MTVQGSIASGSSSSLRSNKRRCTAQRRISARKAAATTMLLASTMANASLPMDLSYSAGCIPLNVTFTPRADGYPYTIWIAGKISGVATYRIDKDFQPGAEQITFQWPIPSPTGYTRNYVVAISDALGNGNVSQPQSLETLPGQSCTSWLLNNNWYWGFDAQDPDSDNTTKYEQCGPVLASTQDNRGQAPFTLTYLPIGKKPQTIQIPASATNSSTSFAYNATIPYAAGTQLIVAAGDANFGGGSGGASHLLTIEPGPNTGCLAEGYQVADLNTTNTLPISANKARFSNLAGALPADFRPPPTSHGISGGIIGGIIGAVVALVLVFAALFAWWIIRKRRERRRNHDLVAEPKFVDLADQHNGRTGLLGNRLRNQRRGPSGDVETYSVSPFRAEQSTYSGTTAESSPRPFITTNTSQPTQGGPPSSDRPSSSSADFLMYAQHVGTRPAVGGAPNMPVPSPYGAPGGSPLDEEQAVAPRPRRVVMHTDGGALPQPESDDEDDMLGGDELPPSYGGWDAHAASAGAQALPPPTGHPAPLDPQQPQQSHALTSASTPASLLQQTPSPINLQETHEDAEAHR